MQKLSTRKSHRVPSRCAPADGTPLKPASVCPADSLRGNVTPFGCARKNGCRPLARSGRLELSAMCPRSGQSAKVWYLCRCQRIGKSEQFRRREPRSVPESTELRPHHIRSDTPPPCRGVEAAIVRGEHSGSVSDHSNYPFDSIRYHLRVLDNVGQRVDNAGHQNLFGLQRKLLEATEFMSVTRTCEGEI